jgi:hypothetical protein
MALVEKWRPGHIEEPDPNGRGGLLFSVHEPVVVERIDGRTPDVGIGMHNGTRDHEGRSSFQEVSIRENEVVLDNLGRHDCGMETHGLLEDGHHGWAESFNFAQVNVEGAVGVLRSDVCKDLVPNRAED